MLLSRLNSFRFSQLRSILSYQAQLKLSNPQTLEVNIPIFRKAQSITLHIPANGTLSDIENQLKENVSISNVQFVCNDHHLLPSTTPLSIMLNRYFFITSDEYTTLPVQGEAFDQGKDHEIIEGLRNLQLPAITQKEVQSYLERIDKWVQAKYGKSILDESLRLPSGDAAQIFIDSMIDPHPQQRNIHMIEAQWKQLYWEVEKLREKKRQADVICMKKARQKMALGLVLFGGNIGFIWSGTYIFWSWDIVQPLAYFISSIGGIAVAFQFFKLGKPYSNFSYQEYLAKKHAEKVYNSVGFSENALKEKEYQLKHLESILKDYFIKKL